MVKIRVEIKKLGRARMPRVPKLKKILGPSFVLLGLGLGSGELLLWPYLTANWGLGILWGALLGISFQFVLNMEIERWALINGESVMVGMARKWGRGVAIWFILSTLIPWMWPGIIMAAATIAGEIWGGEVKVIGLFMLLAIGLILSLGPVVYKTEETIQKWLIFLGVPVILVIAVALAKIGDWQSLAEGLVGKGNGWWWLPPGLPVLSFLGAFAYSGAGGNLNLAQSYYVKEKGYGMGKYGSKIRSLLTGKKENAKLEGKTFTINKINLKRFEGWWKVINIEHGLVFWLTGFLTIAMLAMLSYSTVFGETTHQGLAFLFAEAKIIGLRTVPAVGMVFLLICLLMLFSTQLSVLDATSRIMSENLVIFNQKKFKIIDLAKFYYAFLWLEIVMAGGIIMLGVAEPLLLVTISAGLNAVAMLVYAGAVMLLNTSELEKKLRPSRIRVGAMIVVIVFLLIFCGITIGDIL